MEKEGYQKTEQYIQERLMAPYDKASISKKIGVVVFFLTAVAFAVACLFHVMLPLDHYSGNSGSDRHRKQCLL
jgi:hypothetical protein